MKTRFCLALLLLCATASAQVCVNKTDHRRLNQAALESLQVKKVNSRAEDWRLDAKEVAARELAPLVKADAKLVKAHLIPLPGKDVHIQSFALTNGKTSYTITVQKLAFLLPYSGTYPMMMWTVTELKTACGK
jgi:hypothetical protein